MLSNGLNLVWVRLQNEATWLGLGQDHWFNITSIPLVTFCNISDATHVNLSRPHMSRKACLLCMLTYFYNLT